MQFAIRDDDTCFFTQPEEIESAYDFLCDGDVISLSIVPHTVPLHKNGTMPYGEHEYGEYSIEENHRLIAYLKEGIRNHRIDPLLHGYSHEYLLRDGQWISEMKWKDEDRLRKEIREGKELLQRLLDTEISVFVPPSNHIGKAAVDALERNDLNLSGIILINDRKVSARYLVNFARRWTTRLTRGIQYGGVLDYGKHRELCAYATDSEERLKKEYLYCKQKNFPFVIYTHYWSINKNPREREIVRKIYDFAKQDGAEMVGLSGLF